MIEDELEAGDDDELPEGSDENYEYVPQSAVDEVGPNKPKLESDRAKKTRQVGARTRGGRRSIPVQQSVKLGRKTIACGT